MANPTSRLQGDSALDPGSYVVADILLTANNGEEFDIKDMVDHFTITESLYMASIEAEFVMVDAVNLLETLKITGSEKIYLKVERKSLKTKDNDRFELNLYIAEVLNHSRGKPGVATYVFRCVSSHAYINQTMTLDTAFKGTIGSVVKSITKAIITNAGTDIDIHTNTKENIKGIFPKLRPIAAIGWLMGNTFDEHNGPYYYYQTAGNGKVKGKRKPCIKFASYTWLLDQEPYNTEDEAYIHAPFFENTIGDEDYYEEERKRIRKVSSEMNLSKYISASEGAFSSTLHTIDIAEKKRTTELFQYTDKMKKLNKYKPFVKQEETIYNGRSIEQCTTGKNYYVSLNSMAFTSALVNFHAPTTGSLLKAESYLANEDIISHNIDIAGDFNLSAGSTINVKFLKTSSEAELGPDASNMTDKLLSGRCLVTSITHTFKDSYIMSLQIKNDSFNADLSDGLKVTKGGRL